MGELLVNNGDGGGQSVKTSQGITACSGNGTDAADPVVDPVALGLKAGMKKTMPLAALLSQLLLISERGWRVCHRVLKERVATQRGAIQCWVVLLFDRCKANAASSTAKTPAPECKRGSTSSGLRNARQRERPVLVVARSAAQCTLPRHSAATPPRVRPGHDSNTRALHCGAQCSVRGAARHMLLSGSAFRCFL